MVKLQHKRYKNKDTFMHVVSGETNINDVGIKKRFKNS